MNIPSAELVYLFGHSLWRDVAYEALSPIEQARLHALALHIYEDALGLETNPGAHDSMAADMAQHAQAAALVTATSVEYEAFLSKEQRYLERSARLTAPAPTVAHADTGQISRTAGDALRIAGRHREAEGWFVEALGRVDDRRPWQGAELFAGLAAVCLDTGRLAQAEELFRKAREHFRAWGNRRGEIVALTNLGTVMKQTGRMDEAKRHYALAGELQSEAGDRFSDAYLHVHLGVFYHESGRSMAAKAAYLHSLEILRDLGDRRLEGMTLGALANLYRGIGYTARAEAALRETLALHEAMRDVRAQGIVLGNLASLFQDTGRFADAEEAYQRALEADREAGNLRSEAIARGNLAILYRETGRLAGANRLFMQAIGQLEQIGETMARASFVAHRGTLCLLCGDSQAAQADCRDVLELLDAKTYPAQRLQHALPLAFKLHMANATPLDCSEIDHDTREAELKLARSVVDEMRALFSAVGHKPLSPSAKMISGCEVLLAEVDAAASQWRPPCVFRGHAPEALKPTLRLALVGWMRDLEPERLDGFTWQNPDLHRAMIEGNETNDSPDWSSMPRS